MPPVNALTHPSIKPSPKQGESADPATQPLTVSVQLTTTADQLSMILAGLGSFIPPDVDTLTVDISVDSGAAKPAE